jgi:hypothetical protein
MKRPTYLLSGVRQKTATMLSNVGSGGVLGSTGNKFGCRQRVEGHPLVKRVEALTTANNDYALAA